MIIAPWLKHVRHAVCAGTLALSAIAVMGNLAVAQTAASEEDDLDNHILNSDKRLLNAILGSVGLASTAPDITYRERSPLVVPQTRELPPPGKAARGPEWPVEPEVKAKRAEAAIRRAGKSPEIVDPEKPIAGTAEARKTGNTGGWANETKGPKEPEFFKMLLSGSLNGSWEEYGKFEGEPPRTSLAQPPAGYLTPSPAAPYGMTPRASTPEKKEKPL